MKRKKILKILSVILTVTTVTFFVQFDQPFIAFAAEVTIDSTVDGSNDNFWPFSSPTHVWISDQVGYVFYQDADGTLVTASSTDAGATWSSAYALTAQTDVIRQAIWYDQWTIGDEGSLIHIVFIDSGADATYYVQYDTSDDSISTEAQTTAAPGALAGSNDLAIVKATDGDLYIVEVDAQGSWFDNCASSCTSAANWNSVANFFDTQVDGQDFTTLTPLAGGDILMAWWDVSAHDLESVVYDESADSWGTPDTSISQDAEDNATYRMGYLGTTYKKTTGEIYLAFADNATDYTTADDNIEVWKYNGSSWSQQGTVVENGTGITAATMGIDEITGTLYVAFTMRSTIGTATTADVYYKSSVDDGATWSATSTALNSTSDDIYGLNMNIMSDERLSVMWRYTTAPNADQLMHETVADLGSVGSRTVRLFGGHKIKLISGKIILHQSN